MEELHVQVGAHTHRWLTPSWAAETQHCLEHHRPDLYHFRLNALLSAAADRPELATVAARQLHREVLQHVLALLFATLQAPQGIPFWIHKHTPEDLDWCHAHYCQGTTVPGLHREVELREVTGSLAGQFGLDADQVHSWILTVLHDFNTKLLGWESQRYHLGEWIKSPQQKTELGGSLDRSDQVSLYRVLQHVPGNTGKSPHLFSLQRYAVGTDLNTPVVLTQFCLAVWELLLAYLLGETPPAAELEGLEDLHQQAMYAQFRVRTVMVDPDLE